MVPLRITRACLHVVGAPPPTCPCGARARGVLGTPHPYTSPLGLQSGSGCSPLHRGADRGPTCPGGTAAGQDPGSPHGAVPLSGPPCLCRRGPLSPQRETEHLLCSRSFCRPWGALGACSRGRDSVGASLCPQGPEGRVSLQTNLGSQERHRRPSLAWGSERASWRRLS